jgi:mRNA-degrading endonuclease toxin of MazEF toxin-antitoxin module
LDEGRVLKRGDVRWLYVAKQNKRRPVLILTRDVAIEYLNEITVAEITTVVRGLSTEVLLDETHGPGSWNVQTRRWRRLNTSSRTL